MLPMSRFAPECTARGIAAFSKNWMFCIGRLAAVERSSSAGCRMVPGRCTRGGARRHCPHDAARRHRPAPRAPSHTQGAIDAGWRQGRTEERKVRSITWRSRRKRGSTARRDGDQPWGGPRLPTITPAAGAPSPRRCRRSSRPCKSSSTRSSGRSTGRRARSVRRASCRRPRPPAPKPTPEEIRERRRAARELRGAQIDVETDVIPLPPGQRGCPACGAKELGVVGEGKESSLLEYVQAHFCKKRFLRETLACKCGQHISTAPAHDGIGEGTRYALAKVVDVDQSATTWRFAPRSTAATRGIQKDLGRPCIPRRQRQFAASGRASSFGRLR